MKPVTATLILLLVSSAWGRLLFDRDIFFQFCDGSLQPV
jgi:hypothetical protein